MTVRSTEWAVALISTGMIPLESVTIGFQSPLTIASKIQTISVSVIDEDLQSYRPNETVWIPFVVKAVPEIVRVLPDKVKPVIKGVGYI